MFRIAGNRFTIADIAVASNLINFHYLCHAIGKSYPKLASYFARIIAHPSIAAALTAEQGAVAVWSLMRVS